MSRAGGCRVLELQVVVVLGMLVSAVAFAVGGRVLVAGLVGLAAFWMAGCGLTLARWFAS